MTQQLHKRFSSEQVKTILEKYIHKELKAKEAIRYLGISRARFYQLLNEYDEDSVHFSIHYKRGGSTRKIDSALESKAAKENSRSRSDYELCRGVDSARHVASFVCT
jgi:transposase